jgi:methylmalonyl-CoA mutase N-terminal domain/subunit
VKIALRTQQVIAEETGVASVVDPLGGSWYVEALTDRMEAAANEYFERIDALGGVVAGIEDGFFQREIGEAAYRLQQEYDAGRRGIVGVNKYVEPDEGVPILKIDHATEVAQCEAVRAVRARRSPQAVERALARVRETARSKENIMPALVEAAHAYATLGETVEVLRSVLGVYQEPAIL